MQVRFDTLQALICRHDALSSQQGPQEEKNWRVILSISSNEEALQVNRCKYQCPSQSSQEAQGAQRQSETRWQGWNQIQREHLVAQPYSEDEGGEGGGRLHFSLKQSKDEAYH